jgi:WD40 repeat protein
MTVDGDVVVVMFPYGECEFEVWDGPIAQKLHSGKLPLYSHPGSAEPGILALSPDGQRLAVSRRESNGLVGGTVYDLRSGREVTKLSPSPNIPRGGLVFTPDGERILRGYQRWNARTGEDITTSLGHRGPILGLAITEDGKTVVTSGHDLTVRGWDPDSGKEKWTTSFPFSVTLRRVDANHVVAKEWANWPISLEKPLVDMNTGTATTLPGDMGDEKVLKLGSTEHKVRDELIMISPDGKTAITLDRSKPSLSVWDWPQGTRRNTLPIDPPKDYRIDDVDGLTVSPDGTDLIGLFWYPTVAVHTGSGLGPHGISCLEQWNLSTGERTTRRVVGAGRSDRWCSNLARHLLSNGKEITDARSGEVVLALSEAEWQSGRRWHDCMWALSADGNTLVSCNGRGLGRGDICWYDLRTRNPKRKAGDLDEPVREVAFLPDGRLVSAGQSAYVWAADR